MGRHRSIIFGAVLSLVLLIVFALLQYLGSPVLALEPRWLLVAGVPLLAALVIGGYISRFKGFGIELEARLKDPVREVPLIATEAMEKVEGDQKRGLQYIAEMDPARRERIARLILVEGRDVYEPGILMEYFDALPELRYLEIQRSDERFVALLPLRSMEAEGRVDPAATERFLEALREGVSSRRLEGLIDGQVRDETSLVDALREMRRRRADALAVVDEKGRFQGLLTARAVERRIADDVLRSSVSPG